MSRGEPLSTLCTRTPSLRQQFQFTETPIASMIGLAPHPVSHDERAIPVTKKDQAPEPRVFLGVGDPGNDEASEHPEAGSEAFGVPADLAVGAPDPTVEADDDTADTKPAKDSKEKK